MFQTNAVVCIKCDGQILRESGDSVAIPFGKEYSIYIKNLNSVRAQVSVSVDGRNATEGTRLIIAPNSAIELERFIKNGNLTSGNRFKFIERIPEIEAHRGIGAEDGLVRVEFWKEQPIAPITYGFPNQSNWGQVGGIITTGISWGYNSSSSSANLGTCNSQPERERSSKITRSMRQQQAMASYNVSDAGITVPGAQSNQQFISTLGFPVEINSTVLTLRLRGAMDGNTVVRPVTVSVKPTCSSCGLKNKATGQFCSRCGTGLAVA